MSEQDTEVTLCSECGDDFDPNEAENLGNVNSMFMCINCQDDHSNCYRCGDVTHNDNMQWVSSGDHHVCEHCIARAYYWCGNCDEYYLNHYSCGCNDDDEYEYGRYIHDYSYQPEPKFFVRELETNRIVKTSKYELVRDTPFMGFELEIESINDKESQAEYMQRFNHWLYCKHDGSLDYGFEIVTHPHTLSAYNLREWGWIQELTNMGAKSWHTGTCGLHVHINKSAFKNAGHIWRFTNLILYNRHQASRLAGRNDNQWASFYREYKQVGAVLKGEKAPQRYTAVNLSNYRTIEVRMFRGSLHEPRVRGALEFVNANFEYTKPLTSHDILKNDAISWWKFTDWVQENESSYPHLMQYLNRIKEGADRVSTLL